ncbi:MAG: hypothetical protein H7256_09900 [Bdellovibrio sp.]|nr:hypothetical protein [Bdellovibrio sp.]
MSVNLTDSYIIPKVLSQFKFRWLVYGAVGYYGLKLLNEKGLLPKQANGALDLVDEGIEMAKEKMGLRRTEKVEPSRQVLH